jgi:hypothetical protein
MVSGGDRPLAPQNNTGVSAVGGAGSKDGVPNIDYTGFAYGQNQATNQQASAAPMGVQQTTPMIPAAALKTVVPLTAPSETPEREITYGMPFGPGAGPEVINLPAQQPSDVNPSVDIIRSMYQQDPRNVDLGYILETIDGMNG